ncbi:MAG: ABC transporter ATP-binding protein [Rhodococcus sp. (in: high G+C Gram-positive bacteria)]
MTATQPPPIHIQNLRKLFGRNGTAVEDVSFTVAKGRVTALLGPNGAGKTTTIRLLLGLAVPDSGTATIHGRRYRDLTQPARVVGTVLDAGGLHPGRTGRQHLRIAAAASGVESARLDAVLDDVDMTSAADRIIGGYSLGMRQRIALATALLGSPDVLVLDEPANGLDPEGMHWLRRRLRHFADHGGSVLLSSHVLPDVEQIADDLVVIANGSVLADLPLVDALPSNGGTLEQFYLALVNPALAVR